MVLAELEVFLSRPIAPTRRVALGSCVLPMDPAPGFGGVLLGGIVAQFARALDEEMLSDLGHLVGELERGRRVPQPRLRHRFQRDRVGLQRSRHRLVGDGEEISFDLDTERGTPAQHVLCAVYAAARVPEASRPAVMAAIRRGLAWVGPIDGRLISHLSGHGVLASVAVIGDPVSWAMGVLDLTGSHREVSEDRVVPSRRTVVRAFRRGVRDAHPDHGADDEAAAERISELTEARRILLG
ncbi:MAG TPA: hypothetical protein VJM33_06505 [Microthrixaceae bacterium]|nr:hypothetical protein [Microthrixaceae bacterium]